MKHSETATIQPGKPWQNGSVESFHATLRRECLNAGEFAHLREAQILIEQWRWEYNTQRPDSSLGYRTPARFGAEARAAMTHESDEIAIEAIWPPNEAGVPRSSSETGICLSIGLGEPINPGPQNLP